MVGPTRGWSLLRDEFIINVDGIVNVVPMFRFDALFFAVFSLWLLWMSFHTCLLTLSTRLMLESGKQDYI